MESYVMGRYLLLRSLGIPLLALFLIGVVGGPHEQCAI
jgi:hypothetical protein